MRKPLFYSFRPFILASKNDQQIMFFQSRFLDFLFHIFLDFFQNWSILGPPSKSDGIQNGNQNRPSGAKMLEILSVGMPTLRFVFKPCFHETIVILVPLGHRGFQKVIFSM
jgi:hypothetical protein